MGLVKISLIIFILMLALITGGYLIILTVYSRRPSTIEQPAIIMILGCPATLTGQPSAIMQTRLTQALRLWNAGHYQQILVTGGAVANQFVEAQVMANSLIASGVPSSKILIEDQATNTFLNFKNSLPLIDQKTVLIVTSSWHVRKGAYYARRLGVKFQVMAAPDVAGAWWWLHIHQYPRYYLKMLYQLVQLPFWHEF